jgi:hypothetical protein
VFLGRRLKAPQVRQVDSASKTRFFHILRVTHRDEVEAPITDWLQEAYEFNGAAKEKPKARSQKRKAKPKRKRLTA